MVVRLFKKDIKDLITSKKVEIKNRIERESKNQILGDHLLYIEQLKSEFSIQLPILFPDQAKISKHKEEIWGRNLPNDYFITDTDRHYNMEVVVYHVPYEGSIGLLNYRVNSCRGFIGWEFKVDDILLTIQLSFINFYFNLQRIQEEYESFIKNFSSCYSDLKQEIDNYNEGLEGYILTNLAGYRQ